MQSLYGGKQNHGWVDTLICVVTLDYAPETLYRNMMLAIIAQSDGAQPDVTLPRIVIIAAFLLFILDSRLSLTQPFSRQFVRDQPTKLHSLL